MEEGMDEKTMGFFHNYTKLAMLAINGYTGKSKINLAKKWRLNLVPLVFYSHA